MRILLLGQGQAKYPVLHSSVSPLGALVSNLCPSPHPRNCFKLSLEISWHATSSPFAQEGGLTMPMWAHGHEISVR